MKKCNSCQKDKEDSDFNKCASKPGGLSNKCKECNKNYLKNHYDNNKRYYLDKNNRRKLNIRKYILSKKIECVKCGESHAACLDFHHKENKTINISEIFLWMWSVKRIDSELAKCEILCANCHRKLHWQQKNLSA